jgi:hypothetical protein
MKEKTMFVLAVGVMVAILVAIIGDYFGMKATKKDGDE